MNTNDNNDNLCTALRSLENVFQLSILARHYLHNIQYNSKTHNKVT